MAISNIDLWNAIRNNNPSFASHTAEGTADLFTEKGWSMTTRNGLGILNEFWTLAMPYYLQKVNVGHAIDRLEESGFGEYYNQPYGTFIRRMSIDRVKSISPAYRTLVDGTSIDPFVISKGKASERFFDLNFDYQALVTMPDEWQNKRIFISEYGMDEFLAGVFEALENAYKVQKYENKLEVMNEILNGTDNPLKASQIVDVSMSATPTEQELIDFIFAVKAVLTQMNISPQTGAYNALGFVSTQDESRLKLLVRAGFKDRVDLLVARNSFNRDVLNLPIDVIEVPSFGGLVPQVEGTTVYPHYDALGARDGWSNTDGGDLNPDITDDDIVYLDPNATTYGILADKGAVFETLANPYVVEPIRNPRGLYTNYWASAPNNGIHYDPLYNVVVFKDVD